MTKANLGRLFKQPIVEYRDADGRRVPAGTPGAKKVKKRSKKWYAKVKDARTGRWKAVPLSVDKGVSRQMLARVIAEGEAERAGLVDPLDRHQGDNVRDYLPMFAEYMKDIGDGERHIKDTLRQVRKIVDACGITTIGDLERAYETVGDYLTKMHCGPRTKNLHRQAVVYFCRYMTQEKKRLRTNPLADLPVRPTPRADQRRKRRALHHDQLQHLVEVVKNRPLQNALEAIRRRKWRPSTREVKLSEKVRAALMRKGKERALLYATAAATGFREGELAALRVVDLHLEGEKPVARLGGDCTKNGLDAAVPLAQEMAQALRDWIAEAGKEPGDLVFAVPGYSSVMRAWKKDLAAAGIEYKEKATGRVFDFHSLRKCLATFLRMAGVDPAVSMKLMRHSDIRLTMQTYNDDELHDLHAAVQTLPSLSLS